jgi:stage III sporulation protein AF
MMEFLGHWIKHIVLLILLASFLDLILPNSNMKRYVKLVVGLLLILMILSPILELFKFDYDRMLSSLDKLLQENNSSFEMRLELEQQKLKEMQEGSVLEEVATTWGEEMKNGIERAFDLQVLSVALALTRNGEEVDVQQVVFTLSEKSTKDEPSSEHKTTIHPIQPVLVQIDEYKQKPEQSQNLTQEQKKLEKEVLKLVQDEWNISVDKISFSWTGGDQNGKPNME